MLSGVVFALLGLQLRQQQLRFHVALRLRLVEPGADGGLALDDVSELTGYVVLGGGLMGEQRHHVRDRLHAAHDHAQTEAGVVLEVGVFVHGAVWRLAVAVGQP